MNEFSQVQAPVSEAVTYDPQLSGVDLSPTLASAKEQSAFIQANLAPGLYGGRASEGNVGELAKATDRVMGLKDQAVRRGSEGNYDDYLSGIDSLASEVRKLTGAGGFFNANAQALDRTAEIDAAIAAERESARDNYDAVYGALYREREIGKLKMAYDPQRKDYELQSRGTYFTSVDLGKAVKSMVKDGQLYKIARMQIEGLPPGLGLNEFIGSFSGVLGDKIAQAFEGWKATQEYANWEGATREKLAAANGGVVDESAFAREVDRLHEFVAYHLYKNRVEYKDLSARSRPGRPNGNSRAASPQADAPPENRGVTLLTGRGQLATSPAVDRLGHYPGISEIFAGELKPVSLLKAGRVMRDNLDERKSRAIEALQRSSENANGGAMTYSGVSVTVDPTEDGVNANSIFSEDLGVDLVLTPVDRDSVVRGISNGVHALEALARLGPDATDAEREALSVDSSESDRQHARAYLEWRKVKGNRGKNVGEYFDWRRGEERAAIEADFDGTHRDDLEAHARDTYWIESKTSAIRDKLVVSEDEVYSAGVKGKYSFADLLVKGFQEWSGNSAYGYASGNHLVRPGEEEAVLSMANDFVDEIGVEALAGHFGLRADGDDPLDRSLVIEILTDLDRSSKSSYYKGKHYVGEDIESVDLIGRPRKLVDGEPGMGYAMLEEEALAMKIDSEPELARELAATAASLNQVNVAGTTVEVNTGAITDPKQKLYHDRLGRRLVDEIGTEGTSAASGLPLTTEQVKFVENYKNGFASDEDGEVLLDDDGKPVSLDPERNSYRFGVMKLPTTGQDVMLLHLENMSGDPSGARGTFRSNTIVLPMDRVLETAVGKEIVATMGFQPYIGYGSRESKRNRAYVQSLSEGDSGKRIEYRTPDNAPVYATFSHVKGYNSEDRLDVAIGTHHLSLARAEAHDIVEYFAGLENADGNAIGESLRALERANLQRFRGEGYSDAAERAKASVSERWLAVGRDIAARLTAAGMKRDPAERTALAIAADIYEGRSVFGDRENESEQAYREAVGKVRSHTVAVDVPTSFAPVREPRPGDRGETGVATATGVVGRAIRTAYPGNLAPGWTRATDPVLGEVVVGDYSTDPVRRGLSSDIYRPFADEGLGEVFVSTLPEDLRALGSHRGGAVDWDGIRAFAKDPRNSVVWDDDLQENRYYRADGLEVEPEAWFPPARNR